MPSAYSFESDLPFEKAIEMLQAIDNWAHQPNLDGKWLIRDNDRLGDYLSWYAYDESDPKITKTICLYFDTKPRQVTWGMSHSESSLTKAALEQIANRHRAYILETLLLSLGARNIQPSDFEK